MKTKSVFASTPSNVPVELNEHGTLKGGVYEQWYNDYRSWLDENGLASGALLWAEQNLPVNGQPYYFDTRHIERDDQLFTEGYIRRTQKRGQPVIVDVEYHVGYQKYVHITPYEITVTPYENTVGRKPKGLTPYQTYRPFREADGSVKFRLIHELVERHVTYDELPVHVNYLLVEAQRVLWESLKQEGNHWKAVLPVLQQAKPLSKFNYVPVSEHLAEVYRIYLLKLNEDEQSAVDAASNLVAEASYEALRFKASLKPMS